MKLRFATYKNQKTADQVRVFANAFDYSLTDAKRILEERSEEQLEYFDEEKQEWIPVPRTVEYRD